MSAPITPAVVNEHTVEALLVMPAESLLARLPQHPINITLYLAANDGCEKSLEVLRDRVWRRWEALGLV